MDDDEIFRQVRRFRFAAADVRVAWDAACRLDEGPASDLDRALETAVAVCYARPFKKHGVGALKGRWARAPVERLEATHRELLHLRDKVYAHTDETPWRLIVDARETISETSTARYLELYALMDPRILPDVIELCVLQFNRFMAEANRLEKLFSPDYSLPPLR